MSYISAVQRRNSQLAVDSKLPAIGSAPAGPMSPAKAAKENVELFHEGSKFFWRSRLNVDLHLFLHRRHDTMEVIPYNVETQEELDHLYIDYPSLCRRTEGMVEEKLNLVRAEMAKDRFKKMPAEKDLREDVNKKTIVDYLLVSLVVEDGPSGPRLMLPAVIEGEPVTSGHTPPVGLPVVVVRRRRKTAPGEFSRAMSDFRSDSFSVAEACQRAQELTVLSHNVIGKFQKALESGSFDFGRGMSRDDLMTSPSTIKETGSVAAKRWKWAIKRVIRQRAVAKVTEQLRKREMRMSFPIDCNSPSVLGGHGKVLKSVSAKGTPPKLEPIPDGVPVGGGLRNGVPPAGPSYNRSASLQDRNSRSIAYSDARAKRSSRDTSPRTKRASRDSSPSTIAEHKPSSLIRPKGQSDSEGEEGATGKKKLGRGKSRDWAPRDGATEAPSVAVETDIKPKRRARATNVSLPPRSLAPMAPPPG